MALCTRLPRPRVALAATAALALALAACGGDDDDPSSSGTVPSTTATSEAASLPPDVDGQLMFSRFDESSHTFLSTHISVPDGSGERELALPGPEGGGAWSHDGQHIAVMTILDDDRVGTAVISPDGTVERVLAIPEPTLNLVCTTWSPDDTRLACEGFNDDDRSQNGIYSVLAADGSDLQRLTTTPAGLVDSPGSYSPDGSRFIFKRSADEAEGPLMVVDPVGGEAQPFSDVPVEDAGRFSPDGTQVLSATDGTIVVFDLDGTVAQSIEDPGAYLFGPTWSPDGQWIGYSRSVSGPYADIFISRPNGDDRVQVTATEANEIALEWGAGG